MKCRGSIEPAGDRCLDSGHIDLVAAEVPGEKEVADGSVMGFGPIVPAPDLVNEDLVGLVRLIV